MVARREVTERGSGIGQRQAWAGCGRGLAASGPGEVKLREFRREARADGPHLHHGLGRAGLQHRDPGSALLEPEYGRGLERLALQRRPACPVAPPSRGPPPPGSARQDGACGARRAPPPAPRPPSRLRVFLFHARFSRPVCVLASLCGWRTLEVRPNSFVLDRASHFSPLIAKGG